MGRVSLCYGIESPSIAPRILAEKKVAFSREFFRAPSLFARSFKSMDKYFNALISCVFAHM